MPQKFVIESSFAGLSRAAVWVFAIFGVACLALPFLAEEGRPRNQNALYAFAVFGFCFFSALAWFGRRVAKQLPSATVAVDDDGLWLARLPKDTALLRWEEIRSIRERPYLQRLDLLDATGHCRLRLEYQLAGFEHVRALVMDKARLAAEPRRFPVRFRKSSVYHLLNVGSLFAFSLLGLYVGSTHPLVGYGGTAMLVAMILYEYLTTVARLVVARDELEIGYPLRKRVLRHHEVTAVAMDDEFTKGSRFPEVKICVHGAGKPIRVRGLGVDAVHLHRLLRDGKTEVDSSPDTKINLKRFASHAILRVRQQQVAP